MFRNLFKTALKLSHEVPKDSFIIIKMPKSWSQKRPGLLQAGVTSLLGILPLGIKYMVPAFTRDFSEGCLFQ